MQNANAKCQRPKKKGKKYNKKHVYHREQMWLVKVASSAASKKDFPRE